MFANFSIRGSGNFYFLVNLQCDFCDTLPRNVTNVHTSASKRPKKSICVYEQFGKYRKIGIRALLSKKSRIEDGKYRFLFRKNWKNLEYKTAPKVQKLNTRQSSNTDSTVFEILFHIAMPVVA